MYRWVALLLLVSASPAYAEGGPFSGALDLTIWTWVVFLLLFFILKKYAWGPMLEGLKKREDNIHQAMQEAQHARTEAQQLRNQLQAEVSKAHETVREILDEARRDAQHTKDEMVNQARQAIQDERERTRREIEMMRDQAMQELWNRTAELATQISNKAIRRSLSVDDHRRLVDEALAGLGQAGKEYRN